MLFIFTMQSLGLAMYSTLVPSVYCCFYCPKVFPFAIIGEVVSESRIIYPDYMYGSYYYVHREKKSCCTICILSNNNICQIKVFCVPNKKYF